MNMEERQLGELLKEAIELLFDADTFLIIASQKDEKGTLVRVFSDGSDADLADYLRDAMSVNEDLEDIVNDVKALLQNDRLELLNSSSEKDL